MAYVNQGAGDNPWWNRDGLRGNADGTLAVGYPVTNDMTPEEIAIRAKIDWTVEKLPVFNQWDGNFVQVPDKFNLTRMTDGRVLDVVGKLFKSTQNMQAIQFFQDFVKAGDMTMNTAGSLRGGQRIWALAKINEGFTLVGGDRVEGYLLLSLPHKQGEAITVKLTKVRVVCRNTELAALNGWGSAWRMSHVHEFDGDMQQAAKEALGLAKEKVREDAKVAEMLEDEGREISAEELKLIAAAADLVQSVEMDTSTDDGESYTMVGNVNTSSLRILGFDVPPELDEYRERVKVAFESAQHAQTAWFEAQRELEKAVGDGSLFDEIENHDLRNYDLESFIECHGVTICHVCNEPITDEQIDTETPEGTIHMECEKQDAQ